MQAKKPKKTERDKMTLSDAEATDVASQCSELVVLNLVKTTETDERDSMKEAMVKVDNIDWQNRADESTQASSGIIGNARSRADEIRAAYNEAMLIGTVMDRQRVINRFTTET